MRLRKTEQEINDTIQSAIRYLSYQEGMTDNKIGQWLGYKGGQMIGKVRRGEASFSLEKGCNLCRLASHKGFDEAAELFSAPAKMCVPSTAGEASPNLSLLEENQTISISVGQVMHAFNSARITEARQALRQSIAAHFDAFKELDALAAMQASRGDGAPSVLPNATVSTL